MRDSTRDTSILLMIAGAVLTGIVLIFAMFGCKTGTQRIAESSVIIRENAASSLDRFERADIPEGAREQRTILREVDGITVALPTVEPYKSNLQSMIETVSLTVGIVAILVISWYLGLGQLIRTAIGWIPRPKRDAAKLLKESMDDQDPTSIREAVAALRASDRELDAAYRKLK